MDRALLRPGRHAAALALLAAVGGACAGEPECLVDEGPAAPVTPVPAADFETTTPAAAGLEAARLDDAAAYSESIGGLCLLVVRDGRLAYERYYNGASTTSTQKAWSVTKSVTSTLLGIAQRKGRGTCMDRAASDWIDAWRSDGRSQIQLQHLASHTSGLQFDQLADIAFAIVSANYTADAIALPLADPVGSVFHYSQQAVQALGAVLASAVGTDLEAYARRELWDRIGASSLLTWEHDATGNVPTFAGLMPTCRDLARLGLLYLNRGTWGDDEILTPAYVRAATTPSQAINPAVGYLWWLNGQTPALTTGGQAVPGILLPHAPADTFSALGLGQNFVDVVPSEKTVIVHMRPAPHELPGPRPQDDLLTAFVRDGEQLEHEEILRRLGAWP